MEVQIRNKEILTDPDSYIDLKPLNDLKVLIWQTHVEHSYNYFGTSPEQIENYKRNRDSYSNFYKFSSYTCKRYAERWGFDYRFDLYEEEEYEPFVFGQSNFDQFKATTFFKKYDAVLYLDTDVLIMPWADNIIEEYSPERDWSNIFVNTIIGNKLKNVYLYRAGSCNTGVVLYFKQAAGDTIDRKLRSKRFLKNIIEENAGLLTTFRSGQFDDDKFFYLFHNKLEGSRLCHLDAKYNTEFYSYNQNLENVSFLHCSGGQKQHIERIYNKVYDGDRDGSTDS
jgi:hypothetical protein